MVEGLLYWLREIETWVNKVVGGREGGEKEQVWMRFRRDRENEEASR